MLKITAKKVMILENKWADHGFCIFGLPCGFMLLSEESKEPEMCSECRKPFLLLLCLGCLVFWSYRREELFLPS